MANPSRLDKIQITGNSNSATATKVNVQEANGEVNTQTINNAFNKNFGLNSGDVVGANTLLNQYSTTPSDWTAQSYVLNSVVFYGGKQWIAKMPTVAGDVPAASSKWEEITFDALANKTVIVDAIPTDGSNNAVSSNGVFDALATKAPISSVHNPVTLGTANGLSLDTQQISLGLASSGVTGALSGTDWNTFNGKFNTPTGLTTNNLPKWTGSGFGNSNIFDNGTTTNINTYSYTSIDLDYQSYVSGGATITGKYSGTKNTAIALGNRTANTGGIDFLTSNGGGLLVRMIITQTGNTLFGKTNDAGDGIIQANGNITAYPATTANQVVVKSQLDAVAARPYKVYTALLSQSGTNAPTATVLENTLGGTIVWSRNGLGSYSGTLSGVFTTNKTYVSAEIGELLTGYGDNVTIYKQSTINDVSLTTIKTNNNSDGVLKNSPLEIRVYN